MNHALRHARFTSSQIGHLMTYDKSGKGFGAPAKKYIKQKQMESRLERSIKNEFSSNETSWGNLIETRVFNLLGLEYKMCSKETIQHPTVATWAGSPDAIKYDEGGTVVDFKCPFSMESFCDLVDAKDMTDLRDIHQQGDIYYYQLVSNAILTNSKYAELIIYTPYRSELSAIRDMVALMEDEEQRKYKWITWADDYALPWIPDNGHYANINIKRFEVPVADKVALYNRVVEASKLLITSNNLVTV